MYLLDTNACIRILNNTSPILISRLKQHNPLEILLCSVVKAELTYGAYHSSRAAENLRLLNRFFDPYLSIPFDDSCIEAYGQIRSDLIRRGTPIGPNDLLIAATAVANNLTLITANTNVFSHVAGLLLANCELPA